MKKASISIIIFAALTMGVYALDAKYAPIVNAALSDLKTHTTLSLLKGHVAVNISSGNKELDKQFAEAVKKAYPAFESKEDTVHNEDLYQLMVKVYREDSAVFIYVTVTNFENKKIVERTAGAKTVSLAVLETLQYETAIYAKNEFEAYLDSAFANAGEVVQEAKVIPPPPPKPPKPPIKWPEVFNEGNYRYSSIGIPINLDKSKFYNPKAGLNLLIGYNRGNWRLYLGLDGFFGSSKSLEDGSEDNINMGLDLILMVTWGLPFKIGMFTLKPYLGIGLDSGFMVSETKNRVLAGEDSNEKSNVNGVSIELGLEFFVIKNFFISASYRQRMFPAAKKIYLITDDDWNTSSIITDELFFKRFVISIGYKFRSR